jgi:adenosylcobyric acid synthase
MPYLNLPLPSEDSVSLGDKNLVAKRVAGNDNLVEIAVIKLPRISNFTDFEPLERSAAVRYVALGETLGNPDAVIIPGTKNTVSDLEEMKRSGMDRQILALRDTPILGICGGYQILGREIIDCGIEDTVGTVSGLGLLDAVTRFDLYEKRTLQVRKKVTGGGPILEGIRGQEVAGYEIHMGVTFAKDEAAFGDDGSVAMDGLVIGTYLHGIFENENFRNAFLEYLYARRNEDRISAADQNQASLPKTEVVGDVYEELARAVEINLHMDKVWRMLGLV